MCGGGDGGERCDPPSPEHLTQVPWENGPQSSELRTVPPCGRELAQPRVYLKRWFRNIRCQSERPVKARPTDSIWCHKPKMGQARTMH